MMMDMSLEKHDIWTKGCGESLGEAFKPIDVKLIECTTEWSRSRLLLLMMDGDMELG